MSKRFMGAHAKIEVALALDEHSAGLIEFAGQLAERTDVGLRFVHAVPPMASAHPSVLFGLNGPLAAVSDQWDMAHYERMGQRLRELVADAEHPRREVALLRGEAADVIMADAEANGAALLLLGAGHSSYRHVPPGMSTCLSVLAWANRPVMVAPYLPMGHLGKKRLKMLIADDLTLGSETAVRVGLDLARALGSVDVLHVHISKLTPHAISELTQTIARRTNPDGGLALEADKLYALTERRLQEAMALRAPEHTALLPGRGSTYAYEVIAGDIRDELSALADRFAADIMVFGRHQGLKRHPLALGRVTHRAMLEQKRLLVVAPLDL